MFLSFDLASSKWALSLRGMLYTVSAMEVYRNASWKAILAYANSPQIMHRMLSWHIRKSHQNAAWESLPVSMIVLLEIPLRIKHNRPRQLPDAN